MKVLAQSLGIDVSGKNLEVNLKTKNDQNQVKVKGSRKFDNGTSGITALQGWLGKKIQAGVPLKVVMEATGVYYEKVAYMLHQQGFSVHVLLPNRTKAYLRFLNVKSKTDKIEASGLAQLGLDQQLPEWKPASVQMYSLKRLSRERHSLVDEKAALSNRLHAEKSCQDPDRAAIKRLNQRLKLLEKQIKEVEQQLMAKVQQDPELSQKVENICSIKGLGPITVVCIIVETNGFELIRRRSQLVSYAGYDVVERQSGSSINGKTRISKKGNAHIRRALHFPALCVVKYQTEFADFFNRVFERSKIKMKAYTAVQRKLLVLIFTLFRKNQPYDPSFLQNLTAQDSRQATS